tara:strand:+ start:992 stop:1384 length:393 start_codon:yes stop_codon:yes gene_type:complete
MGDLTKNFSKSEFECNDGSEMPQEVFDNVEVHAYNLQVIRDFFDASVTINSAYRSPSYNAKVGGATKSQHLTGNASDITIKGYTPDEVADIIEGLIRIDAIEEGGVGRYNTFTHYDRRGTKARWDNTTNY